jgi:hypothetical protein
MEGRGEDWESFCHPILSHRRPMGLKSGMYVGRYIHDMKEKRGIKAPPSPRTSQRPEFMKTVSHNTNIRRANGVPIRIRYAKGKI